MIDTNKKADIIKMMDKAKLPDSIINKTLRNICKVNQDHWMSYQLSWFRNYIYKK